MKRIVTVILVALAVAAIFVTGLVYLAPEVGRDIFPRG